jgi:hypothetical protein
VQYRVIGVHPTGLTVSRGAGRCPQEQGKEKTLERKLVLKTKIYTNGKK